MIQARRSTDGDFVSPDCFPGLDWATLHLDFARFFNVEVEPKCSMVR